MFARPCPLPLGPMKLCPLREGETCGARANPYLPPECLQDDSVVSVVPVFGTTEAPTAWVERV